MELSIRERLLLGAAYMGQLDEIQRLVGQNGVTVDVEDEDGCTPLIHAAREGHLDIVRCLVEAKANVEATDDEGNTAIILAAKVGEMNMVQYLVKEARANLEETNDKGQTALIEAAQNGDLDVVQCLLEAKATVGIEESTLDYRPPLMHAARFGRLNVVQHLVEEAHANMVEPRWEGDHGHTALMHAVLGGCLDVVRWLLQAKANLEAEGPGGQTALSIAVANGKLNVVQYLVKEAHANFDTKDSKDKTALMYAARRGNLDILRCLLEAKANLEAKTVDFGDLCSCDTSVVRCLLEAKVNLEGRDACGETLLHSAVTKGNLNLVQYLVKETHVNLDERDEDYFTPLMKAIMSNKETAKYLSVIKCLVEARANLEATVPPIQLTVLHLAAACARYYDDSYHRHIERVDVVQYLVNEARANLEARDSKGRTPLIIACNHGATRVVRFLLDARADPLANEPKDEDCECDYEEDRDVSEILRKVPAYATFYFDN